MFKIKGKRPEFPDEKWVKKQIKHMLEELGIWYFMPNGSYFGRKGIPDFICCDHGYFVGIEAKRKDGVWSKEQKAIAEEIAQANGKSIVVDEDGLQTLKENLESMIGYIGVYDLRGADNEPSKC